MTTKKQLPNPLPILLAPRLEDALVRGPEVLPVDVDGPSEVRLLRLPHRHRQRPHGVHVGRSHQTDADDGR